jgi:hypothetical protein
MPTRAPSARLISQRRAPESKRQTLIAGGPLVALPIVAALA